MSKSNGRAWPYFIGGAITLVFGFCVATIVVTSKANIQESNQYMTYYQNADAKANDLIKDRIAFDKSCKIEYINKQLSANGTTIEYKITDINGNPINNAKLKVLVSRPETHTLDKDLENPIVENGIYKFKDVAFPKPGVYNLIAKVEVGDLSRFYNIKADTRYSNAFEF
jgi:nitrogen fixation protein FixH